MTTLLYSIMVICKQESSEPIPSLRNSRVGGFVISSEAHPYLFSTVSATLNLW